MIEYRLVKIGLGQVSIEITKQKWIQEDFYFGSRKFISSNNFMLVSDNFPCNSEKEYLVYVQGSQPTKNNYKITMPMKKFAAFKEAVEEYNNQTLMMYKD